MEKDSEEIGRKLISEILEFFPHFKWEEYPNDPVELSIGLPVQPGLKYRLWLALQNGDELCLGIGEFQGHWFPCSDPSVAEEYRSAVVGFITGSYRLVDHFKGKICIKTQLQKRVGSSWKLAYTAFHFTLPIPWKRTYRVSINA